MVKRHGDGPVWRGPVLCVHVRVARVLRPSASHGLACGCVGQFDAGLAEYFKRCCAGLAEHCTLVAEAGPCGLGFARQLVGGCR